MRTSVQRHFRQRSTKSVVKSIVVGTVFLFWAVAGSAQVIIEQSGVVKSRTLSGHADFGESFPAANGITVELCSADWRIVLASTKTDRDGYFSLAPPKAGKVFNVRLSAPGVNIYKLRVRINKHGLRELTVHMQVGT